MKRTYTLLFGIIFSITVSNAQTFIEGSPPSGFSYKATILKSNGSIVPNKTISLQISILQGRSKENVVYSNIFHPKTSEYGQIDIIIDLSNVQISWDQGPFYLKTEYDDKGGNAWLTLSTTQLLSVPYSLYSGSATTAKETDPVFVSHPAYNYSPSLLNNGNIAYSWGDHSTAGYVTKDGMQTLTNKTFTSPIINSPSGLTKADVNLGEVDNTSDLLKPISASTKAALESKENALTFNTPLFRSTNIISLFPATSSSDGFLSSIDKVKLDGLQNANGSETKITSGNNISVSGNGTVEIPYSINSTVPIINGNNKGDMQYWDGTKWVLIPVGLNGQVLTIINGTPAWVGGSSQPLVITTTIVSSIFTTSAKSGGNITSDGGNPITERGVCWSKSANPTILNNKTNDGSGAGSFSSSLTGLDAETIYYVRAYAINSAGPTYGDQQSFTTRAEDIIPIVFNPNLNYGKVSDIDGNVYKTIKIGPNEWMAENLKVTKYSDGTPIPDGSFSGSWGAIKYGAYCEFLDRNLETHVSTYGRLYNYYAIKDNRNLCPTGWHVPIGLELEDLLISAGGLDNGAIGLKEIGIAHWADQNLNNFATNETGFTALPGGMRTFGGSYLPSMNYGGDGYWWFIFDPDDESYGQKYFTLTSSNNTVVIAPAYNKEMAMSVRCINGGLENDNDTDVDGIPNAVDPDPVDPDSDNDGLNDGAEDKNFNGIIDFGETNPLDADTDDDGISDGGESVYSTNPLNADTDSDGLTDGLEVGKGEPGVLGGNSNSGVIYLGTADAWFGDSYTSTTTNPIAADTDNDLLSDYQEDKDHDGAFDANETNPQDADTDDDSDPDGTDCKPLDNTFFHGATEICGDGIDQDCSGTDLNCWQSGMLDRNNYYRAEVGERPVSWSNQLAEQAQTWADHLASTDQLEHSTIGGYMENIAYTIGTSELNPAAVVDLWASEKANFNLSNCSCPSGLCGHYWIIINYHVSNVGCGKSISSSNRWYYVCQYTPPSSFVCPIPEN
jgi:uncharacterized protein (TIGR02145 family)